MESALTQQFNLMLSCIREIPTFDGREQSQLPDFLAQVEALLPSIATFEENNRNILFGYIKNKCIGKTREAIHRYGVVGTWEVLKEILVTNFGEKETTRELMDKLKTWRLDSTIEKYHYSINNIRNRLHNRRLTNSEEGFSADEINRISLEVFKDNLPEPTKTIIFARNPQTLEAAFKIILEARQQNYTALGSRPKTDNTRPSYRSNFSNDVRNTHSGNRSFDNFRNRNYNDDRNNANNNAYSGTNNNSNNTNNDSTNRGNYRDNNRFDRNVQQPDVGRQSNQTRNSRYSRGNVHEPMDIGNSNVNFHGEGRNYFPI